MPATAQIHRHTPTLTACDPRALVVRQVAYCRADEQHAAERRINRAHTDASGQSRRQWDPRLFHNGSPLPSQQSLASLSGRNLSNESGDGGLRLSLPGEAGQTSETWDTRGNHWRTEYDERLRPLLIHETASGRAGRIAERFTWSTVAGNNRQGRLVQHDDEAGSRHIKAYSLTGAEQEETRYLLKTLDLPDWPEDVDPDSAANSALRHSPLGEVLERIDTLGNREHSRFNLSGQSCASRLELADGSTCPLLTDARYNAFGQIETQTTGNGVISQAEYDPADGRLTRLSVSRPGRSRLQELLYAYDRIGNVERIEDLSQPVSYFANQRVDPVSTFSYDSLSQLLEATGREAAGALIGPELPGLAPDPGDTSRLLNYRQRYAYDASGNLLSLQHIGQQPYTRTMNVAEDSNRAVAAPGNPLTAFDPDGNLQELQSGQPLDWNARNQLHGTRQVLRKNGENDEERYRYGGDGLRVRKVVTRQVSGRMQQSETRYLPGLELHTRQGESFAVITTQAGRCAVRCLVWREGQPEGIANPQLRYSLDDLHDSSGLELDSEANIISHEGYYPFGGTAWWAANSAIEASYKTRRYSGKERDSTGLYDYGLRYYAPWLMRWINPDPAGDIDGLNRYRFVRNNPATLKDSLGLNPQDQTYQIKKFSKEPKERGSERMTAGMLAAGVSLRRNLDAVAEFAYNAGWSLREYLHLGASNQAGDVKASDYEAMIVGNHMRTLLGKAPVHRDRAMHSLAARTGLCDEYGVVGAMLMSSSTDWPNVPIYRVKQEFHVSSILGDSRETDPLVVDGWVAVPVVHAWSQSYNSLGSYQLTEFTPRMPGDPTHAISYQQVEALRDEHYTDVRRDDDDVLDTRFINLVYNQRMWLQATAMRHPQSVYFQVDSQDFNAAAVPASLYEAAYESLSHGARLRNQSRFMSAFRRF